MTARIDTVRVTAGDIEVCFEPKELWGDNPRFYAEQIDTQLDEAKRVLRDIIRARFGPQEGDQ